MNSSRSRLVTFAATCGLVLSLAACASSIEVALPSNAATTSGTASSAPTPPASNSSASSTSSDSTTPTVDALTQQITANFNRAKSAHLVGTYTKDGETRKLDISGAVDGSNQRTVLTIDKDNVKAEIRTVGDRVYVNGNEGYYRTSGVPSSRAKQVAGRWLSVPAITAGSLTKEFSLRTIFTDLASNIAKSRNAGLTVTGSTRNGQKVWQAANAQTTIVVAADGSGRLVSASNNGLLNTQAYTFDQWDSAPTVEVPADAITT
ncbi:hypothetical protein [Branchiibius sp. NY16-3462-2]|uniref:hypothetical protein n=1 Tax=Branchiibius sp. NY16-3462-2 TaxID=1807500 RepID=UPI0007952A91|nr:hypothetical protein [Branchiibius sp. NY16-3462-2]KYH45062.1 hypothetical protein AZH51_14340 [Branchiibius sp. NY16-3462-2]